MENTSCGCNCPLVKAGVCKSDYECPNYIESWWKEGENGDPKLIKDCAPKRILMQQGTQAQNLIHVQAAICDLRNTVDKLCSILLDLTVRSREYANKQIEHID